MNLKNNNQILMDECIRQELSENENFNSVNDFFEFFASSMVLKDYDFTDDEIISGLTGQGNDGGIDSLYLLVNDEIIMPDEVDSINIPYNSKIELVILQAKYESSYKEDVFQKWKTTSSNLLDIGDSTQYKQRYSEKIIDVFTSLKNVIKKTIRLKCKLYISYHYVTLGITRDIHPNVHAQKEELISLINSMYPSAVKNVLYWGADELMNTYYRSPNTISEISFDEQPISLSEYDLVALVNLSTYYAFITDDSGNLNKRYFEANVRDYQGKNSVNKSISDTLRNPGNEDFWWLNNGVTMLVSDFTRVMNKKISIENPEIVNGLQTSREIYNYFKENPSDLESDKRNVLIRIIKPSDESSRDRIIYATNNQTNIPQYSLRVTNPIHVQIELYLKSRGLYYDRRNNYYKNQQKKPADIIGVAFLAQCLISLILKQPDYARARPSTLLTNDEIYQKLYSGDKDLAVYYNAALIGKKVKVYLNTTELSRSAKNDILFYVIYVVVAKCIQRKEITFDDIKTFDITQLTNEVIQDAIDLVHRKYEDKGATGSVAKSPGFINDIDDELIFD